VAVAAVRFEQSKAHSQPLAAPALQPPKDSAQLPAQATSTDTTGTTATTSTTATDRLDLEWIDERRRCLAEHAGAHRPSGGGASPSTGGTGTGNTGGGTGTGTGGGTGAGNNTGGAGAGSTQFCSQNPGACP